MPGQALGYKIGELKIKELRARAEAALGEDFDIRHFHEQVLRRQYPPTVLEAKIDDWTPPAATAPRIKGAARRLSRGPFSASRDQSLEVPVSGGQPDARAEAGTRSPVFR